MKKLFIGGLLAALLFGHAARAQDIQALVVSACGSPPFTYTAGQVQRPTVDTSGKLCLTTSGGGTSPGGVNGDIQINNAGTFGGLTPGSGVASALTLTLNGTGPISATTNPQFVTPNLGSATASSLTLNGSAGASTSTELLNGNLFTGGSGTTTFPQMLFQPTGTAAVTTWATGGTPLGMNLVSGFSGNPIDIHVAGGPSLFKVASTGAVMANGQSTFSFAVGAGANFVSIIDTTNTQTLGIGANSAGIGLINNASKTLRLGTNNVDRMIISATADMVSFGSGTTLSFPALKRSTTTLQARLADDSGDTQFTAGILQTLSSAALTLTNGAIGMGKITASGSAPGAAGGKLEFVCGTNSGTAKLTAAAGTSATAVTLIDNIGAGVTGC